MSVEGVTLPPFYDEWDEFVENLEDAVYNKRNKLDILNEIYRDHLRDEDVQSEINSFFNDHIELFYIASMDA